jgi:hypothetical protein
MMTLIILNKSVSFDADLYFFDGSEDSYSEIDNTTKSKKTYEFESQSGDLENETTRNVTIKEDTEKDHDVYYDYTKTIEFYDDYDADRIRSISSEYFVSEEKTVTGQGYKEETAIASFDNDNRWKAGLKSLINQWTTENIDASGTRTYDVNYSGTGSYPDHRNIYCFSLVEWNLTDSYDESYEYSRETDSRNNSNPGIENHVTGNMTTDGKATSFHCWNTYWDGTPEPKDGYDQNVAYAGVLVHDL